MTIYFGYTESPEAIAARLARWEAKHKKIMAEKAAEQSPSGSLEGK